MGELTIKLEDATLLDALAEMASAHQRPIEAEIETLLQKAVEDHARRLELVRRADAVAAMTPKNVAQTDSVEIIRAMRAERDDALGH